MQSQYCEGSDMETEVEERSFFSHVTLDLIGHHTLRQFGHKLQVTYSDLFSV